MAGNLGGTGMEKWFLEKYFGSGSGNFSDTGASYNQAGIAWFSPITTNGLVVGYRALLSRICASRRFFKLIMMRLASRTPNRDTSSSK